MDWPSPVREILDREILEEEKTDLLLDYFISTIGDQKAAESKVLEVLWSQQPQNKPKRSPDAIKRPEKASSREAGAAAAKAAAAAAARSAALLLQEQQNAEHAARLVANATNLSDTSCKITHTAREPAIEYDGMTDLQVDSIDTASKDPRTVAGKASDNDRTTIRQYGAEDSRLSDDVAAASVELESPLSRLKNVISAFTTDFTENQLMQALERHGFDLEESLTEMFSKDGSLSSPRQSSNSGIASSTPCSRSLPFFPEYQAALMNMI